MWQGKELRTEFVDVWQRKDLVLWSVQRGPLLQRCCQLEDYERSQIYNRE